MASSGSVLQTGSPSRLDRLLRVFGRQMLWLSTTREEKNKAKQAIDTFFFRMGDMLAAPLVWAETHALSLDATGFARVNLLPVAASIGLAVVLLREPRRLGEPAAVEGATAPA